MATVACAEGEYFDTVVHRCFHCIDICDPRRGTERECLRECPDVYPDYFEQAIRTSTLSPVTTTIAASGSSISTGIVVVIVLTVLLVLLLILLISLLYIKYRKTRAGSSESKTQRTFIYRWRKKKGRKMVMESDHTAALTLGTSTPHSSLIPKLSSDYQSKHSTLLSNVSSFEQKYPGHLSSSRPPFLRTFSTQTEIDPILISNREATLTSLCSNCSSVIRNTNTGPVRQAERTSLSKGDKNNPGNRTTTRVAPAASGVSSSENLVNPGLKASIEAPSVSPKVSLTNSARSGGNYHSVQDRRFDVGVGTGSTDSSSAWAGRGQACQRWSPDATDSGGQGDDRLLRVDDDDMISLPSAPESLSIERPVLGGAVYPDSPCSTRDQRSTGSDSHEMIAEKAINSRDSPARGSDRYPGVGMQVPAERKMRGDLQERSSPDQSQTFSLSREVNKVSLSQIERELGDIRLNNADDAELGLMMNDPNFESDLCPA